MKICFVISDVATEPVGTSVVLMRKAHQRGHEVYVMNVGGFNFYQGAPIKLTCKKIPEDPYCRQKILATGFSCRSQVKRINGFRPLHPVQALLREIIS